LWYRPRAAKRPRFRRFKRFRGFRGEGIASLTAPSALRVLKFDGAFAPKVLRFDGGFAAEGCGGRFATMNI
jgi:hypothetical protein